MSASTSVDRWSKPTQSVVPVVPLGNSTDRPRTHPPRRFDGRRDHRAGAVYNLINAGFIGSLHDATLLAAITSPPRSLGLVMGVGGDVPGRAAVRSSRPPARRQRTNP